MDKLQLIEAEIEGHSFDKEVWDTGQVYCSNPSHRSSREGMVCWRAELAKFLERNAPKVVVLTDENINEIAKVWKGSERNSFRSQMGVKVLQDRMVEADKTGHRVVIVRYAKGYLNWFICTKEAAEDPIFREVIRNNDFWNKRESTDD